MEEKPSRQLVIRWGKLQAGVRAADNNRAIEFRWNVTAKTIELSAGSTGLEWGGKAHLLLLRRLPREERWRFAPAPDLRGQPLGCAQWRLRWLRWFAQPLALHFQGYNIGEGLGVREKRMRRALEKHVNQIYYEYGRLIDPLRRDPLVGIGAEPPPPRRLVQLSLFRS